MNRSSLRALLFGALIVTGCACVCSAASPEETLEHARSLAAANRYSEALAMLEPLLGDNLKDQTSWEIAAEAGRAAFHLGQYRKAHEIFQRVVKARPIILEPALYLEATSYLLGEHRQAYIIFEAVLQSGVHDLYLAVTLPGEKQFLSDPEVRALLRNHAQPLIVRPETATVHGVRLGQGRHEIARTLGIDTPGEESTLTARAGPFLTWIFTFNDHGLLKEVILNADHLRRFTPFRLDLSEGISWTSTPIDCIGSLGGPKGSSATADGSLILTWDFSEASLDLVFSRPDANNQAAALLEMVRLYRRPAPGN